ncbi:hypothetical protein N9834_01460 [Akkermansiaceae bacterium]|nr:hypothetical protein [Akkermansiaceae bacterium]MDB4262435.1 acyl-CoA thioesterase [bacterium]MDB0055708.1 hypothetical protein [Akkermansiaceae bacterium]MDB4142719.1 hypothetical protein [Akkermansiaceae bacterium]MDB4258438.1 hypothetical protein [Akkermansiaceae bacterium]
MQFFTRKWVKPEDLNGNQTLFGGRLLGWIDEEAAIYAMCQLKDKRVVTKFMSEINFLSAACHGDVIEIGLETVTFGRTSMTMRCEVRNKDTKNAILTIEKMVFVVLDGTGKPRVHGVTE